MALDFDVENADYRKELEEIRTIKLPESHWVEVANLIERESQKASLEVKRQQVDDALMHRRFTDCT